jgi:hypothetical protein
VFIIIFRTGTALLKEEGDAASIVKQLARTSVCSLATIAGRSIYVATAVDKDSLNVQLAPGEECSSLDIITAGHNRCVRRVVRGST